MYKDRPWDSRLSVSDWMEGGWGWVSTNQQLQQSWQRRLPPQRHLCLCGTRTGKDTDISWDVNGGDVTDGWFISLMCSYPGNAPLQSVLRVAVRSAVLLKHERARKCESWNVVDYSNLHWPILTGAVRTSGGIFLLSQFFNTLSVSLFLMMSHHCFWEPPSQKHPILQFQ